MQHTSSELLEFPQLKHLLKRYVASPFGHAELEALEPISDRAQLETALAEVAEAVSFTRFSGKLHMGGLVDTTMAVQKLRIEGATLDGREIGDVIHLLERTSEVRNALISQSSRYPLLTARAERLGDFR